MSRTRRKFRALNGILLLDKPLGLSSNRALQDVRHLYQAAKAGHTGSLDPLAGGMLPVCFGEATKVSAFLLDADKRYLTTATLGAVSSTGDAEGDLLNHRQVSEFTDSELDAVLSQFRGVIQQIPPMYSALKRDGQPLYKLARQGVEVERAARTVTIHELILHERTAHSLTLEVQCSKGTYIRSLVEDIGEALGCGAYVSQLRRTQVAPFENLPMYAPDELRQRFDDEGQEGLDVCLLPMDCALPHLSSVTLDDHDILRLRQGQKLSLALLPAHLLAPAALTAAVVPRLLRVYTSSAEFVGLIEVTDRCLKPKRLLSC